MVFTDVKRTIHPEISSKLHLDNSLRPSTVTTVSSLAIALLCYLPIQGLKLIGFMVSPCLPSLQCLANKLHAILITHAFINLITPSSSLCFIKNIATKNVIWNDEDTKEVRKIIEENNLEIDPSFKIEGAKSDGICNGASLVLIKEILSSEVKEESDLVKLVSKYTDGFPAQAAALQILSAGLLFSEKKKFLKEIEDIRGMISLNEPTETKN